MGAILSLALTALRGALPLVGGFFTGGLSWVWSLVAAFAGTELGSKIIIGLACILGGFIWGFSHEHAAKTAAVAVAVQSRDADWGKTIAEANAKNETRIQEALNAARNASSTPPAGAQLVRLCTADADCRKAIAGRKLPHAKSVVDH